LPESTSKRLLDCCLAGNPWARDDLRELVRSGSPELFSVVAEGLSDRFHPALVDAYVEIFSEAVATVLPGWTAEALRSRYARVRDAGPLDVKPSRAVVLSRVTLGADIAVTSRVLDAVKRAFPDAEICLAGGVKCYELFAADPRIRHIPVSYGRGAGLAERVAACPVFDDPATVVLDPDSRLTQLGLVPCAPESNYRFFESRAYGNYGDAPIGYLAARWIAETLGVLEEQAYIAAVEQPAMPAEPAIAVSFGVGDNPAKRLGERFEAGLLKALAARAAVIVDCGAGGEEEQRVLRAIEKSGASGRIQAWKGSFAAFASIIGRSAMFAGYDSAGQHAAAAFGVPRLSVFAGYPSERFMARWRPAGPGPSEVIAAANLTPAEALDQAVRALDRLSGVCTD
jgi:ADP-heptose:LPS heptosyltransferase